MPHDDERRVYGDPEAAADAFEHLPFMAVVTDGPDLTMVAFNGAIRAVTENRTVYGDSIAEVFRLELDNQGWGEAYRRPVLTGETVVVGEHRAQLHHTDGSVTEMYVDAVFSPLPGPDGRPRGTIMTGRDVTERVRQRAKLERELDELRDRYAAAVGSVRAMQRALLADSVPVLPGFDVAARYVPADDEQAAGGDWFDAVARPDGSLVLVVGDVVGHGQAAAVAMGQLRSVLLAQLRAGSGVAEALSFLDGFAGTVPAARRATVCIARIEESGEVEYCTAGHPPPLVLAADDTRTGFLAPSGAGPLATGTGFPTVRARLADGDAVVLYSDGLLERPGATPAAASLELLTTAGAAHRNTIMPAGAPSSAAERICTLTIELLTRTSGHTDDLTILAAQRRPVRAPFHLELEMAPDAIQRVRTDLRAWLEEVGPRGEQVEALLHATTELVANVFDHAYLGAASRPVRIAARLERDSSIVIEVTDRGSWRLPVTAGPRGRGLALVRHLVDRLDFARSPGGTTACIQRTVHRPAGLLERIASRNGAHAEQFDVWPQGGPQPVIALVGPLDAANLAEASAHLELVLSEATAVVTVDLTHVTLLASAGVDMLFGMLERAHRLGLRMELIAPNGSPAQHVLSLVRLPHRQAMPAGE